MARKHCSDSIHLHSPGNPGVTGADTGAADDVSSIQQVALALFLQRAVSLLVARRQLAGLVLQLLQLLQLGHAVVAADLVVQRQVADGRVDRLATLGAQAHHLQAGAVDLLRQLVDGDVGRRAHQHRPAALLHQVVHDRR